MLRVRSIVMLVVLCGLAVTAAYYISRPAQQVQVSAVGQTVFPDLLDGLNDVARIVIRSAEGTVTVQRDGDAWGVSEKHGYPADMEKVRGALFGTAELEKLEAKTSNPDLYARLDLQDIDAPDAKSVSLRLEDDNGQALAALIVGKQRPSRSSASTEETYIRLPDDPQTWLAAGSLSVEAKAQDWLLSELIGVNAEQVGSVRVVHADGEQVTLLRDQPGQADFRLDSLPEGAKPKSSWTLNNVASTFTGLRLDDVLPSADANFPEEGVSTVEVDTFDGLTLRMETAAVNERYLSRFSVAVASVPVEQSEEPEQSESQGEKPSATQPATEEPEDPQILAANLRSRFDGWVFVFPDYSMRNILKRQDDLVEVEKTEETVDESADEAGAEVQQLQLPGASQ